MHTLLLFYNADSNCIYIYIIGIVFQFYLSQKKKRLALFAFLNELMGYLNILVSLI